jgi:Mg-chelatase subunit ChlD
MSKQHTIAFLVFLALFSFATMNTISIASKAEVCPDFDYRPEAFTSGLIASLNKLPREQRKAALEAELKKDTLFISSSDAVKIFTKVRFDRNQISAVGSIINNYIIRFSPQELSQIVKGVKKKLQPTIAVALKNALSDVSPQAKAMVLNSIQCEGARAKVAKEFESIKVRSCVVGQSGKDVVFLIDLSGSMQYSFKKGDQTHSRLTYLKPFIVQAIQGFDAHTQFKIVTFATGVRVWKSEWVMASNQNKADAIKFVNNMRGLGMTNTIGGLREAFKVDKKDFSILVFTDGMPTKEETNTGKIVDYVTEMNAQRLKRGMSAVKIDLTTVMLGGKNNEEELKEKADTLKFCEKLAKSTGGTFKNFK